MDEEFWGQMLVSRNATSKIKCCRHIDVGDGWRQFMFMATMLPQHIATLIFITDFFDFKGSLEGNSDPDF